MECYSSDSFHLGSLHALDFISLHFMTFWTLNLPNAPLYLCKIHLMSLLLAVRLDENNCLNTSHILVRCFSAFKLSLWIFQVFLGAYKPNLTKFLNVKQYILVFCLLLQWDMISVHLSWHLSSMFVDIQWL